MVIRFYMFDTILHDVSINCNDTDRCYWFALIYRYYLVFLGHSCILMIQIGYTDSLSFIVTISSFDSIMIFDTVVQFCFIILYWYKSISSDSLFCIDTGSCLMDQWIHMLQYTMLFHYIIMVQSSLMIH